MKKSTVTAIINALAAAEKYEAKVKVTAGNKPFDISAIGDLDTAFDTAIAAIIADLPDDADGGQAAAIVKAIALSEKHDSSVYVASDNKPFNMSAITDIDDAFDSAIEDVVDDVPEEGGSGDYVTLDTEQTITGNKTFTGEVCVGASSGAERVEIQPTSVQIVSNGGAILAGFDDESIGIGDEYYEYSSLPVKVEYSTTANTVTLTLGNGKAITLTCTNVEEVSE